MQALSELLKVTHRGYFIPPRPEKNPVEGQRATDEFVEVRRNALEKYIIQLAMHPAIVQSDVSAAVQRLLMGLCAKSCTQTTFLTALLWHNLHSISKCALIITRTNIHTPCLACDQYLLHQSARETVCGCSGIMLQGKVCGTGVC